MAIRLVNIQILTSSYPSHPDDPTAAAGLFVRAFALELRNLGHRVIIQPVARKGHYIGDVGIVIEPLSWRGGDQELASMNLISPLNWLTFFDFFRRARPKVLQIHTRYHIDRTLCMWAVPAGLLGYWMKKSLGKPYDVWVLGSDLWKVGRIPLLGRAVLRAVLGYADRVFADGHGLCREVETIAGCDCGFLPSSRELPSPLGMVEARSGNDRRRLLFVGRYHRNKGPDLLVRAVGKLPGALRDKLEVRMYGVGPLKQQLLELVGASDLGRTVCITDGIAAQDMASELARADYLVIPSRIESIPVVFSDALQAGTPVIVTPVGDLPELVSGHRCGLVAAAPTAEALAEAIRQACCFTERDALAGNALRLAKQFHPGAAARQWLANLPEAVP